MYRIILEERDIFQELILKSKIKKTVHVNKDSETLYYSCIGFSITHLFRFLRYLVLNTK